MSKKEFSILDVLQGSAIVLDENGHIAAKNSSWIRSEGPSSIFGSPL